MPAKRTYPAKNYSEYISFLREREVIPSFEETRALLLAVPRLDKEYLTLKFTLFSLIALFFFASPLTPETIQKRSPLHSRNIAAIGGPVQKTISNDRAIAACKQISLGLNRSNRTDSFLNPQTSQTSNFFNVTDRISPVDVRIVNAPRVTPSKITAAFPGKDVELQPNHPSYDIALGNSSTFANSPRKTPLLNPTLEFQLNLDSHSSLALELSSPGLNRIASEGSVSFHDTTFRVGPETTHNVLGHASIVSLSNSSMNYALFAGYRYQIELSSAMSPFAEVLLGTDFSSVLTSEKLGIRFTTPIRSLPLSIDLAFRSNQLLVQHPLLGTNIAVEIAAAYAW